MEETVKSQAEASQWVYDYSDMLYRYALQRVRSADTAKDLVQDTFLSAWRNYGNYRGDASVKSWLFVILKSKLIDYYRRIAGNVTGTLVTDDAGEVQFFNRSDHWLRGAMPATWRVDEESSLEKAEFYSVLDGCKRKLKDVQNAVFTMKYMEDLDSDEICKVLDLSPSNYWVLLHRAKTAAAGVSGNELVYALMQDDYFMIFIHCKQAVDFVSKREELKLSRMEVIQLKLHLFICAGCRRFVKQNAYVVKAMKRYREKQDDKGLTDGDRDRIVRGMVE